MPKSSPYLIACSAAFALMSMCSGAQSSEELSKQYCAICHQFPAPHLLDKSTWELDVLPEMGLRMGIQSSENISGLFERDKPVEFYPEDPLLTQQEWAAISQYYIKHAPEILTPRPAQEAKSLLQFDVEYGPSESAQSPATSAIMIDAQTHHLLGADATTGNLSIFDGETLERLDEIAVGGPVSHIARIGQDASGAHTYTITLLGPDLAPTQEKLGSLLEIKVDAQGQIIARDTIAGQLHRPVQAELISHPKEAERRFFIAEFGNFSGALSQLQVDENGNTHLESFTQSPGATKIIVQGEDAYILFAQGDERILHWRRFLETPFAQADKILSFPPTHGTSNFNIVDANGDDFYDLIVTHGDNADTSQIFKPYHGIKIFLGQADGTFEESFFFHLDGATDAIGADFDQDGDMDIAAIAYYGRVDEPGFSSFIYLENMDGQYQLATLEELTGTTRFIAMTSGDIDADGDLDIALANLKFGPLGPAQSPQKSAPLNPSFVLLRNKLN